MPSLFDDVRYSIRAFGKSPGFTITAIAALGIGIGATTAVFSIVNTVLLRPIPFPDPDSLLVLATVDPSQGSGSGADETVSPARFVHLRAQSDVLHDVAAIVSGMTNYSGGGNVEPLTTMRVSAETFSCFGIAVRRGRGFTAG
ncbi:MAG TPA: ABC transporter permease, partial [Candidatus Sulfopaludibacter sp.]|nr:ABC transporter permease [Candidatus Sulfopaludibacter sp.]